MNQALTLSDILVLEDSEDILKFKCPDTGIPLWSTIRVPFLRLIISDLFYGVPIEGGASGGSVSKYLHAAAIARAFAHNFLHLSGLKPRYPIMVMATGARLITRQGLHFNTLSDYFVEAAPNSTLAVEDLFGAHWPFPRHNKTVLLHTPLRVQGVLRGKARLGVFRNPSSQMVDLVIERAKNIIGWDVGETRREWLKQICANGAASILPRYQKYQSIFKKAGVKLLIKEEACYGGADNAAAVLAARHLGMVSAEYQHGAVSLGHDAYNYSYAVSNDLEYRKILPDYFLTYGSWWGEQINAPVKKIAVGNPHRTETLNFSTSELNQGRNILILGDGIETTLYLELCDRLACALGSAAEVVFRPHPLERVSVLTKYPEGFLGKVRIDSHQDIYSSFRESVAVVSEVSTGLFEAIGLVPKVFIWDTAKARFSYPVHPFQGFSDVNELARLLLDDNAGRVDAQQIDSIWAPNWQKNYLGFIERALRQ